MADNVSVEKNEADDDELPEVLVESEVSSPLEKRELKVSARLVVLLLLLEPEESSDNRLFVVL